MQVKQVYMAVRRQYLNDAQYRFISLIVLSYFILLLSACHQAPKAIELTPSSKALAKKEAQHQSLEHSKTLALSRYGNPTRYRVAGLEYEVKRSARNFSQKGIASWYGHPFHKERTSSGEVYDMYQMTAAHKTLPLPSIVKVKNLENNREVVVKVNDRGPFHEGRVIDLSYAAAKKLGMISKGTAQVMLQAIPTRITDSQWYLQAGSFHEEKRASQYQSFLRSIVKAPVNLLKKAKSTIVQIGPLKDRQQTQVIKAQLKHHGIHDVFSLMQ